MKQALIKQLSIDVHIFQQLEINDYSLLLGIHKLPGGAEEGRKLLEDHDKNEKWKFQDKLEQIKREDYGGVLVLDKDRFNMSFFESIDGGFLSKDRTKIYFIGIIDTLTFFGAKKSIEYNLKHLVWGNTISCLPPRAYGDRF